MIGSSKITRHDLDDSVFDGISVSGGGINPNLLDNWYFGNPVNQNGWSTGSPVYGMSLDRWVSNDIKVDVNDGFITLSTQGTTNPFFIQRDLTGFYKTISGKLITMSALLNNGELKTTSFKAADYLLGAITGNNVDGMNLQSFSYATESGFRIFPDTSCSFDIIAVKAELGSEQTLAHQDENGNWVLNEIPNYAEQMAICKQYNPITGEYIGLTPSLIGAASNPNLLDNWYFADPINQRGQTEYFGFNYGTDRWVMNNARLTDSGVLINKIETGNGFVIQKLENKLVEFLNGKTVTISALVDGDLFSVTTAFSNSGQIAYTNDKHFVIMAQNDNPRELCFGTEEETGITISAVKLELGSQQTLARRENGVWVLNEVPNYLDELEKCRRYYFPMQIYSRVHYRTNDIAYFNIGVPICMRIGTPSATITSGKIGNIRDEWAWTFDYKNAYSMGISGTKTAHGIAVNDNVDITIIFNADL